MAIRRGRRRLNGTFELQLTSLMDALVIILVFLLKTMSVTSTIFTDFPGLEMPASKSLDIPPDSPHLIITPLAMTFENETIIEFERTADAVDGSDTERFKLRSKDLSENGLKILPLYNALMKSRENSELLSAKSEARDEKGKPLPFEGSLAIQADKQIPYDTLRRVMYTAGVAGYRVFRFLALRKDAE